MSEKNLKVGVRIELTGKELQGTVAYVGMTSFAVGKWVGVVLDEQKGKNNGTIKGQTYFECPENFGMFVRPTQLRILGARLSGSRGSLSSSRQSLLGSRTQLTHSLTERSGSTVSNSSVAGNAGRLSLQPTTATTSKETTTAITSLPSSDSGSGGNGSSHATSKRASFVETGFIEILKPQFTPSQPMRSPSFTTPSATLMSTDEKVAAAGQLKLNEELKAQLADATEKLETLKQRRNEDKERLREFDKMKIQFEQLQEFRTKIMAAQASLQKELQRSRQETKDAIEARERHAQDMAELADNFEMITLDKEMAEEKSDTLQLELESAKERIEELQVDLELLRSEMQNKMDITTISGGENVGGGMSIYEFKQLEQQNLRLKETLVRLRDMSAHDKHDIQKLSKELEMKKSEVNELERTKEKLSKKIDELEATVADLQEQVDAALGAEEMIEQLAEKKMELEDRVKLLEEEVAQLEALEEVHEQLVESNHDLEMDLREELDMVNASKKELARERDAAIETMYDRDQTIQKFRELVQKLNEQLLEMRNRYANSEQQTLQETATGALSATAVTIDYKQMFAESKAYTRAIDVQLRQIELTQANEHVDMLSAFMPESFMNRGGDHDSILVILLISRIVFKCGIVVSQTRERFPAVELVTRESLLRGHAAQQYAFKCRLMHYIHNLQCALHQILYGLNSCQADTLLRAGNSLPEMVAQEKTIDAIIELLKSNQLDENSTTENIEKCVAFFNAMNSVLLAGEDLVNETQMIRDCVASLGSACEAILNDACIARAIVCDDSGSHTSDTTLLVQFLSEHTESIKQQVKLIRRRLPQDQHVIKCGIAAHKLDGMRQITLALGRIMSAIHQASKLALHTIVTSIESDNAAEHAIAHAQFWELLSLACERIYEQDDRGPSQNFKGVLTQANSDLQLMAQHLLDKEYEIASGGYQRQQEKALSPIILRAQFIKKQLEQKNVLAATLENREADIKQFKLASKLKQSELSEMQIRKDLAEKKLSVLQGEFEHTVEKWKRQYDDTRELLEKKEKEFEDTMDHLQHDIEELETERAALRDKLKSSGIVANVKRSVGGTGSGDTSLTASPSRSAVGIGLAASPYHRAHSAAAGGGTTGGGSTSPVPLITEELQLLQNVCNHERNMRMRLQAQVMRDKLQKLEPIYVPLPKDKRIVELEAELGKIKHAWALSLLQLQSAQAPGTEAAAPCIAMQRNQRMLPARSDISARASQLAAEVLSEYLQRNPHRATTGSTFAVFPSVEVKRVLQI